MIAGTGRNFWLRSEGPFNQCKSIGTGCQRVGRGVNNNGVDANALMDSPAEFLKALSCVIIAFQAKIVASLVAFFLIKAARHIKMFLECGYEFERVPDVCACAFVGVCQSEEQLSSCSFHT